MLTSKIRIGGLTFTTTRSVGAIKVTTAIDATCDPIEVDLQELVTVAQMLQIIAGGGKEEVPVEDNTAPVIGGRVKVNG